MDGVWLLTLLFVFAVLPVQAAQPQTPHCFWSTNNAAAESKQLKIQIEKFQNLSKHQESCPLSEYFDQGDRSLKLGALEAIAITKQSCDVPTDSEVSGSSFLFQTLRLQGLKLSRTQKKNIKASDADPAYLFSHVNKLDCFAPVPNDPKNPESTFKGGDLLIVASDVAVVDEVKDDPFQIKKKIGENKEILERITQGLDTAERVCRDWLSNPAEFKITVLSHVGRTSLFPKFGSTSSVWVEAITSRAALDCVNQITAQIPPPLTRRLASSVSLSASPEPGFKAVRFRADIPACHFNHDQIASFPNLDCVQFCDFSSEAAK